MDELRSSPAARARSEPPSPEHWTPPVTVLSSSTVTRTLTATWRLRRQPGPPQPRCSSDTGAATWRHVQAVNVESALWLAQAFTPGMAERHFGRIVFITSDTFWAPPAPALLAYIASKGALLW